jgi:hypothetical protein
VTVALADGDLKLALIARVPERGIREFQAYEDRVLPLLADHGGVLERRMRSRDGTIELHILSFASAQHLERFRADPRRTAAAHLLQSSGAETELLALEDI